VERSPADPGAGVEVRVVLDEHLRRGRSEGRRREEGEILKLLRLLSRHRTTYREDFRVPVEGSLHQGRGSKLGVQLALLVAVTAPGEQFGGSRHTGRVIRHLLVDGAVKSEGLGAAGEVKGGAVVVLLDGAEAGGPLLKDGVVIALSEHLPGGPASQGLHLQLGVGEEVPDHVGLGNGGTGAGGGFALRHENNEGGAGGEGGPAARARAAEKIVLGRTRWIWQTLLA
jgi:hypothetical protein